MNPADLVQEVQDEALSLVVALGALNVVVVGEDEIRENFATYAGARSIFWRENWILFEGLDKAFQQLSSPLPKVVSWDRRSHDGKKIYWPQTFDENLAWHVLHGRADKAEVLEAAGIFVKELKASRARRDMELRQKLRQRIAATG